MFGKDKIPIDWSFDESDILPESFDFPYEPSEYCKCCGGETHLFNVCDFHFSQNLSIDLRWKLSGYPIYYSMCNDCGFVFTDLFDDMSKYDFFKYIYNDEYLDLYKSDFVIKRGDSFFNFLNENLPAYLSSMRRCGDSINILNYCSLDIDKGIDFEYCVDVENYSIDPFYDEKDINVKFDLSVCFYGFERFLEPLSEVSYLKDGLNNNGDEVIIIGSCLYDKTIPLQIIKPEYFNPRLGRFSIYSENSLKKLFTNIDMRVFSFKDKNIHIAFKEENKCVDVLIDRIKNYAW